MSDSCHRLSCSARLNSAEEERASTEVILQEDQGTPGQTENDRSPLSRASLRDTPLPRARRTGARIPQNPEVGSPLRTHCWPDDTGASGFIAGTGAAVRHVRRRQYHYVPECPGRPGAPGAWQSGFLRFSGGGTSSSSRSSRRLKKRRGKEKKKKKEGDGKEEENKSLRKERKNNQILDKKLQKS